MTDSRRGGKGRARRTGLLVRRGTVAARLVRWRLIRLASLALGAFVAFNGITAVVGHRGDAVTWVSAAAVVLLGVAVWRVGVRFAGPRPQ